MWIECGVTHICDEWGKPNTCKQENATRKCAFPIGPLSGSGRGSAGVREDYQGYHSNPGKGRNGVDKREMVAMQS